MSARTGVVLVDGVLTEQCLAFHDHDGALWSCMAPVDHPGSHRDYHGRTWTGGPYWRAHA